MAPIASLEHAFLGRGLAASVQLSRTSITAKEHDTVELPQDMVRPDGSLDVYDDVLKLFRLTFKKNRPSIQCSGWVGHIPLNDAYALEVTTRVPVANLEKLVGLSAGYTPEVLKQYNRLFAHSGESVDSLFDVMADVLLSSFDRIWETGLLKTYERVVKVSSSPSGRLMPFETELRTRRSGRPTAMSSSFQRTSDFGPNRLLREAFEKLLMRYLTFPDQKQRHRTLRLKNAWARLEDVQRPLISEISADAIAGYLKNLPTFHEHYADALMVANLIVSDLGLSIRSSGSMVILPSILIDMSKIFETYMLHVLRDGLADDPSIEVKDGNIEGDGGAKQKLYNFIEPGLKNPPVTPDILIEVRGKPVLVIDAKYKPAPKIPDRSDVNQVIVYGARYESSQVMVLHAERPQNRSSAEMCGSIGQFKVYNGMADLSVANIGDEENAFVSAVRALLKNTS